MNVWSEWILFLSGPWPPSDPPPETRRQWDDEMSQRKHQRWCWIGAAVQSHGSCLAPRLHPACACELPSKGCFLPAVAVGTASCDFWPSLRLVCELMASSAFWSSSGESWDHTSSSEVGGQPLRCPAGLKGWDGVDQRELRCSSDTLKSDTSPAHHQSGFDPRLPESFSQRGAAWEPEAERLSAEPPRSRTDFWMFQRTQTTNSLSVLSPPLPPTSTKGFHVCVCACMHCCVCVFACFVWCHGWVCLYSCMYINVAWMRVC